MEKLLIVLAATIAMIAAAPIVHWLHQPVAERLGVYRFHSAFLFSFVTADGSLALHFGTLYDFFTKLRHRRLGKEGWGRVLRRDIAEGIDRFADWLETNDVDPSRCVTLGSHFLNERKMKRIGFTAAASPGADVANAVLIYWELLLLQRLFTGRWRIVRVWRWKTYSCTVAEFLANRAAITASLGMATGERSRGAAPMTGL